MSISDNSLIKISIILPFGNDSLYIEPCLHSLLEQNYSDMEILCINCQSSDQTSKIIAQYAEKYSCIKLLKSQSVRNINEAYNLGLNKAKGQYIKFINARVIFHKFAMALMYNQMECEQTDMVIHASSVYFPNQTYQFEAQWNWLKEFASPAKVFDILPFCLNVDNLINNIAFSRQFATDNQLFFDERLTLADEASLLKLILLSQRVSLFYLDLTKQTAPVWPPMLQTKNWLLETALNTENIQKAFSIDKEIPLYKTRLIEYTLATLGQCYKRTLPTYRQDLLKFATDKLNQLCEKTTDILSLSDEAQLNYTFFLTGKNNIKFSIIFLCESIDNNVKQLISHFFNIKNLYIELVIYTISEQHDETLDRICENSDFVRVCYATDPIKTRFADIRGKYCIFQNINNLCLDKIWPIYNYADQNDADILFAVKEFGECVKVENNLIFDDYLKYRFQKFTYLNIYGNKLFDLLYDQAQILYKTEYLTELTEKYSIYQDVLQLSLLATISSSALMMYPRTVAVYMTQKATEAQQNDFRSAYNKLTNQDINEIIKYDEILYRFKVASQEQFSQKLIALQTENAQKQIKYSVKTDIKTQEMINRAEVLASPLWDEKYYLTQFDFSPYDINVMPLDHYLQDGWKKGFSPSAYFNASQYAKQHGIKDINPLVYYLQKGRFRYKGFPTNSYPISEEEIQNYWRHKKRNHKVVYMCITGDYDKLEELKAHTYINPQWDYVCFTDNKQHLKQKKVGIWQIRKLQFTKLDNTRNNRYHKIFPHILFPEYDESIYLDSNINILTPFIYDEIKRRNVDILLPKHAGNFSIYHEYNWALLSKVDKPELIMAACEEIMNTGFPFYYGMPECNIIYRKHSSKLVKNMMNDWWYWIETYAKRDQLSFSYLLWKNNLSIASCTFVNARIDYKDFCVFLHPCDRKID